MNPFAVEGINVSLNTWHWLYLRQDQEIKVPKDEVGLAHLNILVRHGLLIYSRGSFHLTDLSRDVLLKVKLYEKDLREGVPIAFKSTLVDLSAGIDGDWIKGKTREKKPFYANDEIILFTNRAGPVLHLIDEMSLEMDVLVSQVHKAIFAEGYIDAYPRMLQRRSFFEPGIVWFKGNVGNPVSIKETYYDLVGQMFSAIPEATRYAKVVVDKDYIVVINPHTPYRYLEDIIAIISSHVLEGFNECMI